MGNHDSKCTCTQCSGSGSVKGSAGASGAVAGAVVGGMLLGPVGAAVGGLMGSSAQVDKTCDRCDGKGTRSTRDWHSFGGKQMTMYHGTSSSNAASICKQGFKQSKDGMLGAGVYLSADRDKARGYGDTVLEVDVRLGKTKKITSQSDPMRTAWSSSGYDSAWVPEGSGMVASGRTETCVYDPDRIQVKGQHAHSGSIQRSPGFRGHC
ncbi:unnamed protein product [Symbiodinium sp. CCMP2592]|nr:unnamed protein product [Symbiodinium sp. CCMP2592]